MIWVTGSRGMLGREITAVLAAEGAAFEATDLEVDITDPDGVSGFSRRISSPSWIINCAAYTDVEEAERERDRAFAVNCRGVRLLAGAARELGAGLIHISTDYVFNGRKETAYKEDDPPHPLNVYGESKLAGERAVIEELERYMIIRTGWLFGRWGRNFVSTMLKMFCQRDVISVVNDQQGTPTYARDLAAAVLAALKTPPGSGIFHFANRGRASWYQFAREIYRRARDAGRLDREVVIRPVSSAEYRSAVQRPAFSCLSTHMLVRALGLRIRHWRAALAACLAERSW